MNDSDKTYWTYTLKYDDSSNTWEYSEPDPIEASIAAGNLKEANDLIARIKNGIAN